MPLTTTDAKASIAGSSLAGVQLSHRERKLVHFLMALLCCYAVLRGLLAAAGKGLWYDELLTLTVISTGTWHGILSALHAPLDSQPPFFYVIEYAASCLIKNQEISLRLPSILAIPCILLCVFIYVRHVCGELIAFLSSCFVLITSVFQYYAMEARPYSMAVACLAFASVCYQRTPSRLWTVLLGISLGVAQSLHYMAFISMVPFGLAELMWSLKMGKFRWRIWIALLFGCVPLLLLWKLLLLNKAYYGQHFYYAHFPFSLIPHTYGEYVMTTGQFGAGIAALAVCVILRRLWDKWQTDIADEGRDVRETVLVLGFVFLPFIGYLFTSVTHSGMTGRYVLFTAIGIALAFGCGLSGRRITTVMLYAVFVFSAGAVQELHFWRFFRTDIHEVNLRGAITRNFIEGAGHRDLPIVVPDGGGLLWLVHYAFPSEAERLVYLTQDQITEDNGSDTVDKGLQAFSQFHPLNVSTFSEFTAPNNVFLVFDEGLNVGKDWITLRLTREGWNVQVLAADGFRGLYLVTSNRPSGRQK